MSDGGRERTGDDPPGPSTPVHVNAEVEQIVELVLGIDTKAATTIRAATRARPRPRPQRGPSADYR